MANGINYQGGDDIVLTNVYNGILGTLQRQQAMAVEQQKREQARAQDILKAMQSQAAKINPAGLRSVDIDDFNKGYQAVKEAYFEAVTAPDNASRIKAAGRQQEAINNLSLLIGQSKAAGTRINNLINEVAKAPDRYSEQSVGHISKLNSRRTSEISDNDFDLSLISRQIDTSKVPTQINSMLEDIYKTSAKLMDIDSDRLKIGGRGADLVQFIEGVDKQALAAQLLQKQTDPAFRAWMEQTMPGATYEEGVAAIISDMDAQGRFQRTEGRQIVRDQAPSQRSSSGSKTKIAQDGIFTNYEIPYVNGSIRGSKYSGINIPNVVITKNTQLTDLNTGQQTANTSEYLQKGDVVGFISVPVGGTPTSVGISSNTTVLDAATESQVRQANAPIRYEDKAIIQTDDGTFLVDLDAVERANNTKTVRDNVSAFKQFGQSQSTAPRTDNRPKIIWK